jgi:16S rRNA (uracil1498-N3)-methyltransferase
LSKRFFFPELATVNEAVLADEEAHHLLSVCRVQTGETVELFDGRGTVASARLVAATRRSARLQLLDCRSTVYDGIDLVLACPLPKGDRASVLVEKCTELGVRRIVPIETERSVVEPGRGKLDKLRRTVIEACKQSGRNHLMELSGVLPWRELVARSTGVRWLLDPNAEASTAARLPSPQTAAIGPEGGFTPAEVDLARQQGWTLVSLPGHLLRMETAVIALAAWVRLRTARMPRSD